MAVGTAGGLLDTPKATSVFKHGILRQYVSPFLAKVSSGSDERRVMVVDGFAGRGRFEDGTPGSAVLFMEAAAGLASVRTSIRLFEKSKIDAANLVLVADEFRQRGVDVTAERADVMSRLEEVVAEAAGKPLFLFLDPCGQNVPFDVLVKILGTTRCQKWPATEALLNLSADFTRRIGGTLEAGLTDAAGLDTMDRMVGGDWWRQMALDVHAATLDGSWGAAADAVAAEYTRRLGEKAGMGGALIPVRRKPNHQATYHLAYFTRSEHGLWVMADALARARKDWMECVGEQPDDEFDTLFPVDPVGDLINAEQERAMRDAEPRILAFAAAQTGAFSLLPNTRAIYGDDYGVLTESNLGKVMRKLVAEKRLTRGKGELSKAPFEFVR